jgi:hypothetical protein
MYESPIPLTKDNPWVAKLIHWWVFLRVLVFDISQQSTVPHWTTILQEDKSEKMLLGLALG